jgi:hypothetical protein
MKMKNLKQMIWEEDKMMNNKMMNNNKTTPRTTPPTPTQNKSLNSNKFS